MLLRRLAVVGLALVAATTTTACGSASEESASSGDSAFTVANGDRFIVSATPEQIVFKKVVDGTPFPFDETSLVGKAILIHPAPHRADLGVYARALSVASDDSTYTVTGQALTLAEMESISEDDIVRIYIDPSRARDAQPRAVRPGALTPQAVTWFTPAGFSFGVGAGLAHSTYVAPGLALSNTIDDASLTPEVLVDWTKENGLELGFRASLSWRSTLKFTGRVAGGKELYHSTELSSAPWVVTIPIGPVPVPVALTGVAFVTCSANGVGTVSGSVTLSADASLGGSVYIQPGLSAPTSWVHEGSWPATCSGSADATPGDLTFGDTVSVSCTVPRLALKAAIGGAAGPYLALAPNVVASNAGAMVSVAVVAGVSGAVMGIGGSVETTLVTWTP
jgi:hypothetical protein